MKNIKQKLEEIKNLKEYLGKDLPILIKGKNKIQIRVYFGKNVVVEPNVF